jgi:transcriptional regulator with XRE-family HTH domain
MAHPETQAVAWNVSRLLREARITQRDAAEQTGIHLTTLKRRLTGRTPFRVDELIAIADLLNVSATTLIDTRRAA